MDKNPCWKNYKMVGTKKKDGVTVPNCVPTNTNEEAIDLEEANNAVRVIGGRESRHVKTFLKNNGFSPREKQNSGGHEIWAHPDGRSFAIPRHKGDLPPGILNSAYRTGSPPQQEMREEETMSQRRQASNVKKYGSSEGKDTAGGGWDGDPKKYEKDTPGQPSKKKLSTVVKEVYQAALQESPAWQRKEGKNDSGGLNQKGVKSYRAEHPGSNLKTAVTTPPSELKAGSKPAKRRSSFCARMQGMKDKLTSSDTANDPDSRINKSLRKWNC